MEGETNEIITFHLDDNTINSDNKCNTVINYNNDNDKINKNKLFWKNKRIKRKENKRNKQLLNPNKHWTFGLSENEINKRKEYFKYKQMWKELSIEEIPFKYPRIFIDLSFTKYMKYKEIRSVITQLSFTYGYLKKTQYPLQLHLCSYNNEIKDSLLSLQGFTSWKIYLHKESCNEICSFDNLIYLSPDAEDELNELDESLTYIIGGIVDHNRLKGLTKSYAQEQSIISKSLPIKTYLGYQPSNSLNINHVFEILCKYGYSKDWEFALSDTIPKRKIFQNTSNI